MTRDTPVGGRGDVRAVEADPFDVPVDGLPRHRRRWAMFAIAIGTAMAVLDTAVANIALPTIAHQLRATPAAVVWVVNAYQLAVVVTLLPLAALGDRFGFRRVYCAGLIVFTIGSLACAVSHDLAALVASRVLQGVGAAGLMAVNATLIRFTYPQAMLGRGVALNALVVALASAVGPTVASAVLALAGWEWLFAINVPVGLANLLLATKVLPTSRLGRALPDPVDCVLNAAAFGFLFAGVEKFADGGVAACAECVVGAIAGALLVRRARRSGAPLLPVDLMRDRTFALSVGTSVCSFVAQTLAFVSLPFLFETTMHRDQVATGLLLSAWPAAFVVSAPVAGRLSDRASAASLAGIGLTALAIGLASLAAMPSDVAAAGIAWRLAVCGLGFGFFQAPNNRAMLSSAPRDRAGAAGGVLATARLTGMTAGAAFSAILFDLIPRGGEPTQLRLAAGFAGVAAAVSLSRLRRGGP